MGQPETVRASCMGRACVMTASPTDDHASAEHRIRELTKELSRVRGELAEGREQQAATAEILRLISSSPMDMQRALDTVAERAARLCQAFDSAIFRRDDDRLLLVGHHGPTPIQHTLPVIRGTANGRAVLEGRTIQVADLPAEVDEFPAGSVLARAVGVHTHLSVPLMTEGVAIGTINLRRTEVQLFTEQQVALL